MVFFFVFIAVGTIDYELMILILITQGNIDKSMDDGYLETRVIKFIFLMSIK